MNKIGTLVVMTSLVSTLLAPAAFAETAAPAAAATAQQKTDLQLAVEEGAIKGYPGTTDLMENKAVTRAELAVMINRAAKLSKVQVKKASYNDLSDWMSEAVENATAAGIVKGIGYNQFQPNRTINREELAAIIVRSLYKGKEMPQVNEEVLNYFTDKDQISPWARQYVAIAALEGIFDLKIDTAFNPQGAVTRGEAAKSLKPILFELIDILTTNDMHGTAEVGYDKTRKAARGGLETIAGIVGDYREINPDGTIVLDAGDAWQGTLISNTVNGKVMIDAMEKIGYDSMAIGNHEFDYGLDVLKNNITDAQFPILAANIIDDATGQPVAWAKPTTMIERGGLKIGIVGLSTPQTETTTKSTNIQGLTFAAPASYAKTAADELRKQGADIVLANTHLPGVQDAAGVITDELAALAKDTGKDYFDAIIGGHSHKPVAGLVNNVPVVEAWSSTTAMGHIQLYIDRDTKQVVSAKSGLLETYTHLTQADAGIKQLVADYQKEIAAKANEVEGIAAEKLTRLSYRYALNGNKDRDGITPLGALITDAMRASEGSDIAFTNIGGIRADIEAGEITYTEMFTVLPFGNYNVTGTMTAEQVKTALEVLDKYTSLPAMQFSGLMVEWDNTRATGDKYTKITLTDGTPVYVDGKFNTDRTFKVTTNDFMATGTGDGYVVFGQVKDWQDGAILLDAWVDHTKALHAAGKEVSAANDGRDVRLDIK